MGKRREARRARAQQEWEDREQSVHEDSFPHLPDEPEEKVERRRVQIEEQRQSERSAVSVAAHDKEVELRSDVGELDQAAQSRPSPREETAPRPTESSESANVDPWFEKFISKVASAFEDFAKIFEQLWGKDKPADKAKRRRVESVFGSDGIPEATPEIMADIERKSNAGVPAVRELFEKNATWREHLRASTEYYDVCPETVASIMRFENDTFDPTRVNPDAESNATGLGQFTGGTWRDFCKSHNQRFKDDPSMQFDPVGDRLNPKAQIWAISWLCNRNAEYLSKNAGMEIDASNPSHAVFIYLAHHDGPGRAVDVVKYLRTNGQHKFDIPSTYLGKTKQGIKIDSHEDYVKLVLSKIAGGVQAMTTKLTEQGGLELTA